MTKIAHCNCGALRADVQGEPEAVVACHCAACQRRTGSVIGVGAYYAQNQVRITGEHKCFVRTADSGNKFEQYFCPTCGTTVFFVAELKPGVIGIAVGCFADPEFPAPVRSVWDQGHHSWLGLPDGIQHYDRGRAGATPR